MASAAHGRIEVICGSMFSGKTEELIRRIRRAIIARQSVEIYKPLLDHRYSAQDVVSHDDNRLACTSVASSAQILLWHRGAQVVGLDEAQFFDPEVVDVCNRLAFQGVRVIVAGLDMDFMGRPFGPMPALMAIADDVLKVHAICVDCGHEANFSYRLTPDTELVKLGEKNLYQPLCRSCFQKKFGRPSSRHE
ncbi:MAG: thymidine kinase [Flavobacteriales bacterium]|nr:thymidine kinase [Flavobacteriales bacterium]MCX7767821.1 thymidine kinase [Flavobacteriales bacterium]MDW8409778.1 thymidine kinase [Flavobacteriales bacterium]